MEENRGTSFWGMRAPDHGKKFQTIKGNSLFLSLILFQLFSFCFLFSAGSALAGEKSSITDESATADKYDVLENRLQEMEDQLKELESKTVLSEPEMIIKQKGIWVCKNGHEYDSRLDGVCPNDGLPLSKDFTYERVKVFRRQTISEQIQNALDERDARGIKIGVSATSTLQETFKLSGADKGVQDLFGVGSTDLYFIGKPALYTLFFLDIESIGGASPDRQIDNMSLLTSDVARREVDKRVNVREAWLRTELLGQKLTVSAGMLDLTNYFDLNTVANDETSQFITDGLVNNLFLGVPSNGAGVVAAFDPKIGLIFRAGAQRGASVENGLAQKVYSMFEAEYLSRIPGLQVGHYRAWVRFDENAKKENIAWGISADQKITAAVTVFARFGSRSGSNRKRLSANISRFYSNTNNYSSNKDQLYLSGNQSDSNKYNRDDYFYSGGVEIKAPHTFGIRDSYAIAFLSTDLASGVKETLIETYYNLFLTENLRTSFHLQYLANSNVGGKDKSYLIPGLRVQLDF